MAKSSRPCNATAPPTTPWPTSTLCSRCRSQRGLGNFTSAPRFIRGWANPRAILWQCPDASLFKTDPCLCLSIKCWVFWMSATLWLAWRYLEITWWFGTYPQHYYVLNLSPFLLMRLSFKRFGWLGFINIKWPWKIRWLIQYHYH